MEGHYSESNFKSGCFEITAFTFICSGHKFTLPQIY
jgi:hypothetical protein